jgi:hypothetical protein
LGWTSSRPNEFIDFHHDSEHRVADYNLAAASSNKVLTASSALPIPPSHRSVYPDVELRFIAVRAPRACQPIRERRYRKLRH